MPGRIFSRSLMQAILDSSHEIRSLSSLHCHSLLGLEPPATPQLQLRLPEVRAPSQYLIDMGFQPSLAQQLSKAYMDFVARYRTTYELHFNRVVSGGYHLPTECYREVFVALFKRTIQTWDSKFALMVRVRICQVGAPQASFRPERVDIRVDDAVKAEIIARLGLKATRLTSDKMAIIPKADVIFQPKELSEQTHAFSTDTSDSCLMLPESSPMSSTKVSSRTVDPFSQPAPLTCFPAPYPPPPRYPSSYSSQRALATSFTSSAPQCVRPLASYSSDVSSLTDLFGRMTVTTLKTGSTNSKPHRIFAASGFSEIKPVSSSSIAANFAKGPQLASIEPIASPPNCTTTARRRKIAALPTRRGKTSAPVSDLARVTSHPTPRPYERIVEEAPPDRIPTPQKCRLVSTLSSPYTAEVSYFATPNTFTPRQRKAHTLRKTLPQAQSIPQNRTLNPLAAAGETFSSYKVSRSPPLVSDATSYFDSPPTSSDELDTPPSTPPSSHVLLASTSTESLTISSESDRIVSHKEPFGDAKLPYHRQRYRRLDFMKGVLGRDERLSTFTFSV